ncbi:sulfatase-like hydrolase/transferase [Desulfosporosinus sp. FKA]|uniref:sulfatase-like hydrolase/transferase n=1 Tax=Desulfosporosinus sp. FKA TaxID=1969834 RepID=UPI0015582F39|nr:sulfatase-like hydrolase/transferase [Desulfosporosinus sp. FKA]
MNVLFIMSDEHRKDAIGCYGHPVVKTPNLDALAAKGIRFTNSYCNSPLCIPSRASLATGRHVHHTEYWDNDKPYQDQPESWGKHLQDSGVNVSTIGKLHFDTNFTNGFVDQRYRPASNRDIAGLFRNPVKQRKKGRQRIEEACSGDHWIPNTERVTQAAIDYLSYEAPKSDKPWVLYVNFWAPHFPLIAPKRFYDMYPDELINMPFDCPSAEQHPILDELRYHFNVRNIDEDTLRRTRKAYYGLVSYVDEKIGEIMEVLDKTGLAKDTLVIYTSDHGESLGDHELWWKNTMYEQSAGIPLIISGPNMPKGLVSNEPVSLIDLTSTVSETVGVTPDPSWEGDSLLPLVRGENPSGLKNRTVLSQYHGHGVSHGIFMIRKGDYKYVYYPTAPCQLFNLIDDPLELNNLAPNPVYKTVVEQLHAELLNILNPEEVDKKALEDQHNRLEMSQQAGPKLLNLAD